MCWCFRRDDLEPGTDVMCRERSPSSLHHKPLIEGTNNKRKSQGMALFIAFCGEMKAVLSGFLVFFLLL